jgi:hypothetical protein
MDKYNDHARTVAAQKDKCVICHVHADGSGALTHFGERYDRVGLEFTDELMAEFPNLFRPAAPAPAGVARTAGGPGGPRPEASARPPQEPERLAEAPAPPRPAPFDAAQYYKLECTKCHGKYGDGDPLQGVPAFAVKKWIDERSHLTDELVGIIMKGKDKMVGQEGKITLEDARALLELIRGIATQYS